MIDKEVRKYAQRLIDKYEIDLIPENVDELHNIKRKDGIFAMAKALLLPNELLQWLLDEKEDARETRRILEMDDINKHDAYWDNEIRKLKGF